MLLLLLLLFVGAAGNNPAGSVMSSARPTDSAEADAAKHDNFICSRLYGPGAYPLPCKPARDHWQSPFKNTFVITACELLSVVHPRPKDSARLSALTALPSSQR